MLKNNPRVQLLRDDMIPPIHLNPAAPNSYYASTEQWPPNPHVAVNIAPDRPIYFVSGSDTNGWQEGVSPSAQQLGVDAVTVERIHNPPDVPGERIPFELQIIELLTSRRQGAEKSTE
jgi:hypothetical protein